MTMARTALRLAARQIVKGVADARPTIAEGRVYDSRLSPEQPEAFGEDALPLVIVFTDNDEGDALSDQNGGPPFHRRIDLVFDIGMLAREGPPDEEGGYVVQYPDTDARLEASIDVLQAQIIRQLTRSMDPLSLWFQNNVRIWKQESHRQGEDAAAMKIARRVLTLTCELEDDDYDQVDDAEGLDRLPEPLRSVAKLMPDASAGAQTCAALAQQFSQISEGVTFKGVDFTFDAGATPDVADDQVIAKADTGQT